MKAINSNGFNKDLNRKEFYKEVRRISKDTGVSLMDSLIVVQNLLENNTGADLTDIKWDFIKSPKI